MKRSLFSVAVITALFTGEAIAQFAGGSGSRTNPYLISTVEQLQEIKNHPDQFFRQLNDIDARITKNWNDGQGFEPIGNDSLSFSGYYNGNGYKITGLTIRRKADSNVGLFGYTNRAMLRDITIEDAHIEGANNTGILTGFTISSRIRDVEVQGEVSGETYVGGLAGSSYSRITDSKAHTKVAGDNYVGGFLGFNRGEVNSSSAVSEITGSGNGVGGLIGNNYDGSISRSFAKATVLGSNASSFGGLVGSNGGDIQKSYSEGEVTGRSYVGGLAGFNRGTISESYSTAKVVGSRNGIGGLVGNNYGEIHRAYAKGEVQGLVQVGGFAGINKKDAIIKESFSAGIITGNADVGGFIGKNDHPLLNSFWDAEHSGQLAGVGRGNEEGLMGLSTSEMTGSKSLEHMTGFSFKSYWGTMPQDYPQLLWPISYFSIEKIESKPSIISGELLNVAISVKNIGGLSDTSAVFLKDKDGNIIASAENIFIDSNDHTQLVFEWQSSQEDIGEYEFMLETPSMLEPIQINIRHTPELVEARAPVYLEDVSRLPLLQWKEAYLAESYQVQVAKDEHFNQIILDEEVDTLAYQFSDPLDYLTDYFWRVRGVNSEENGDWSELAVFRTVIEQPEVVKLYEPGIETEATSVYPTLVWSMTERAEDFVLQLSKDDEFEELVFDSTFTVPDTSYSFESHLDEETEFFWRVQATNAGGNSDWSEVNSFHTSTGTFTEGEVKPLDFSLDQNYPNPFNATTIIRYGLPQVSDVHLEVLNMLGQTVATLVDERKSAGWHTATFDASDLSSGFYIYRIKARDFVSSKKLMLIK